MLNTRCGDWLLLFGLMLRLGRVHHGLGPGDLLKGLDNLWLGMMSNFNLTGWRNRWLTGSDVKWRIPSMRSCLHTSRHGSRVCGLNTLHGCVCARYPRLMVHQGCLRQGGGVAANLTMLLRRDTVSRNPPLLVLIMPRDRLNKLATRDMLSLGWVRTPRKLCTRGAHGRRGL